MRHRSRQRECCLRRWRSRSARAGATKHRHSQEHAQRRRPHQRRRDHHLHPPALPAVPVRAGRQDRRLRRRPGRPRRQGAEVKQEIVDTPFEGIQSGEDLNTSKCDVAAAGMTITDVREKNLDFSRPYFDATQALLTRKGSRTEPSPTSRARGWRPAGDHRRDYAQKTGRGRRAQGLRGPRAASSARQDRTGRGGHQRQPGAVRLRQGQPGPRGGGRVQDRRAVRHRVRRAPATTPAQEDQPGARRREEGRPLRHDLPEVVRHRAQELRSPHRMAMTRRQRARAVRTVQYAVLAAAVLVVVLAADWGASARRSSTPTSPGEMFPDSSPPPWSTP